MLWKFLVGTLVLPCCLGFETASAALTKDVLIPAQSKQLELSTQSDRQLNVEEATPVIEQQDYKISHHRRHKVRKRHDYQRRSYQQRNYNPQYQRVNSRDSYQDCPEARRRRVNYHPVDYRYQQETYPMNDMIYRRHRQPRH